MGTRRGWLMGIALAVPAAVAWATPSPGLVASIDAAHDGGERALPTDRRFLRLASGDTGLRVRLHPAGDAARARYRFRLEGVDTMDEE